MILINKQLTYLPRLHIYSNAFRFLNLNTIYIIIIVIKSIVASVLRIRLTNRRFHKILSNLLFTILIIIIIIYLPLIILIIFYIDIVFYL